MKILKKLLLINWHYFTHQMIEFEQLNFMTGVNASGKSTIIDALQIVLFGDTAGRYFNKSASGKSARTLASYLCGEISLRRTVLRFVLRQPDISRIIGKAQHKSQILLCHPP